MLLYDGTAFVAETKTQEGEQLVVEWLGDAHVFDCNLDVVDDGFHDRLSPE
jgi:hypothetical protein